MTPLLSAHGLTKTYGPRKACDGVDIDVTEGEVLAIVGESGSGKSTLLSMLAGELAPDSGEVRYRDREGRVRSLGEIGPAELRALARTDWGFVRQDAAQGLRMAVSAGGNVGERLMGLGQRHYGNIRAQRWIGSTASRSPPTGSTIRRRASPAACASGCRSPATSSPRPASC